MNLNGKPLIKYSLEIADQFSQEFGADIGISTDSAEIMEIVHSHGIESEYERPAETATDEAGKLEAISHIKNYYEGAKGYVYDWVLDLDVTSPLRNMDDLTKAYEIMKSDREALTLFSVSHAGRNPYFNMVEEKDDGYYALVKDKREFHTRQSAPQVFDLNASFYFISNAFFQQGLKSVCTARSLIYLIPHRCFDIDTIEDLEFMDFLISENKLDFEF